MEREINKQSCCVMLWRGVSCYVKSHLEGTWHAFHMQRAAQWLSHQKTWKTQQAEWICPCFVYVYVYETVAVCPYLCALLLCLCPLQIFDVKNVPKQIPVNCVDVAINKLNLVSWIEFNISNFIYCRMGCSTTCSKEKDENLKTGRSMKRELKKT